MSKKNTLQESEYTTGDQSYSYRKKRGRFRSPKWKVVEQLRQRWSEDKVSAALAMLGGGRSAVEIGKETGFGIIQVTDVHGNQKEVPDLRGIDVTLLPPGKRILGSRSARISRKKLDFSYFHFEGARLTDLDLRDINFTRAHFEKATLRRVNFNNSSLLKAHLEDADLRDAELINTNLAHIRYTEDAFIGKGTILMETHLGTALYVDPVLEKYARDQYFLYVLKYKNRNNPFFRILFFLWWLTSNYGKNYFLWAFWSVVLAVIFAAKFYQLGPKSFCIPNLPWNFQTLMYYSIVTFTTLGFGDVTPTTQEAAWWVMAEVIVGYVMLGGLISIFATKMAQRS